MPLETLVEADDIHAAPTARMRVRAGQHFERLLAARGLGRYAATFRTAYPIAATAHPTRPAGASSRSSPAARSTARSSPRTCGPRCAPRRPRCRPAPVVAAADPAAVLAAARRWWRGPTRSPSRPPAAPRAGCPTGSSTRSAPSSPDGIALEADEYADGHLDWHTFTATGAAANPPAGRATLGPLTVVPSAVTYPGMPASRLWEFEDARVDFGAVDAQPEDLGRMLLSGFALVYGADWLMRPARGPGRRARPHHQLDVRDTFGRVTTVGPTAAQRRVAACSASPAPTARPRTRC